MEKTIELLSPLLVQVSEKIGEGSGFVWSVVVKQMYIEAVFCLSLSVVGIILSLITYQILIKVDDWVEPNQRSIVGLVFAVVSILLILAPFFDGNAIVKLINPEYYALDYFISLVR